MIVIYAAGALVLAWALAHLIVRPGRSESPFIVSHRGARNLAPENTLRGLREAIAQRAEYTEIDIRRAADGVLVVMHDSSLRRTTGNPATVEALTSTEITRLVVRTLPGVQPPLEDTVPTFDAVLDLIASNPIRLVIEVKDPSHYPGIAAHVAEALQRTGTAGKVLIGSFDHAWLPEMASAAPGVPLAPIADWWTRVPAAPPAACVDYDWLRVVLDPFFVRRMRRQGSQVVVWTVDTPRLMRLMLWLGVDGITTNRPDLCRAVIDELAHK